MVDEQRIFDTLRRRRDPNPAIGGKAATEEAVNAAERDLATSFPDDYRRFLLQLGWYVGGSDEVFGLGPEVRESWSVVAMAHLLRRDAQIPAELLPIHTDGGGNYHLVSSPTSEDFEPNAVYFYDHDEGTLELESDGFCAWLDEYLLDDTS